MSRAMMQLLILFVVCQVAATGSFAIAPAAESDPLAAWRQGVKVSDVLAEGNLHTIHSYFNTSPESPDGRWIVLYSSSAPDSHRGEIRVVDRATGQVLILARDVTVEDAHRAACQQWVCGGRCVVFHDLRDGEWVVVSADVPSGRQRVLATGRQLAWGQNHGDIVPLYGPHWDPGEHRDLELLDVTTGQIRAVVTARAVQEQYADWVARQFDDQPISVFFPILSPDLNRVLLKIASPAGGGFRSPQGSNRYGVICYDIKDSRFVYMHPKWGHPGWLPDSRHIINMWSQGPVRVDCETGAVETQRSLPAFPGGHPSAGPDGRLFTTDVRIASGDAKGQWQVVVADFESGEKVIVDQFDNSKGASSWRRSHPHPVFSPDGQRIYFNVSSGPWTRLHVAQPAGGNAR